MGAKEEKEDTVNSGLSRAADDGEGTRYPWKISKISKVELDDLWDFVERRWLA